MKVNKTNKKRANHSSAPAPAVCSAADLSTASRSPEEETQNNKKLFKKQKIGLDRCESARVLYCIFHQHRTGWVGQGGVDSQKSISSSIEQQSREVFMSGAAGSWLRSKPDPTKTPAATETRHISLLLSYTEMSLQEETSNVIRVFLFFKSWWSQLKHLSCVILFLWTDSMLS